MKERRQSGCINWLAVKGEGINPTEMNELIKENGWKAQEVKDNYFAPTRICDYNNTFYLVDGEHIAIAYCVVEEPMFDSKGRDAGIRYTPKKYTIKKNMGDTSAATGNEVFKTVQNEFQKRYNINFKSAWGYSPNLINCIPAPLNIGMRGTSTSSFYKADVSSAYGFEACKPLPTMNGCRILEGKYEPSELFPFAFYPEEGMLAIYGEGKYLTNTPLTAKQTILCRACPLSLAPIFEEFYKKKEEAPKGSEEKQYWKDHLNYFVGMLHFRPKVKSGPRKGEYAKPGDDEYISTCPRYAAQAAVIKARCNARMLELKDQIEANPINKVILINTDAVGWKGHDIPELYTSQKGFGNLILEHHHARAIIEGPKKYQILDEDGTLTTMWSGIRKDISKELKWGDILTVKLIPTNIKYDWVNNEFIQVNNLGGNKNDSNIYGF